MYSHRDESQHSGNLRVSHPKYPSDWTAAGDSCGTQEKTSTNGQVSPDLW